MTNLKGKLKTAFTMSVRGCIDAVAVGAAGLAGAEVTYEGALALLKFAAAAGGSTSGLIYLEGFVALIGAVLVVVGGAVGTCYGAATAGVGATLAQDRIADAMGDRRQRLKHEKQTDDRAGSGTGATMGRVGRADAFANL